MNPKVNKSICLVCFGKGTVEERIHKSKKCIKCNGTGYIDSFTLFEPEQLQEKKEKTIVLTDDIELKSNM